MNSRVVWRVISFITFWALLCRSQSTNDGGCSGASIPVLRVPRDQQTMAPLADDVSLSSSNDFAYLVNVGIGGQNFLVLLDTGSSDLWVVSSNCTSSDCTSVPRYNETATLVLSNSSFGLQYLSGMVNGTIGSETVTLGPYQISSQIFALANSTAKLGLAGIGNSGILGLSFPQEAAIPDTSGHTILENIFASMNETNRFIAFNLGRDHSSSSFNIGQLDPGFANSTSDLTFTSVVSGNPTYDYWKLPLQSLTINSDSFALSPSHVAGLSTPVAVLDTGTTLILGPSADVERLWASVGAARRTDTGWQVRCDRAAVLGFVLGEGDSAKEYIIDPADLSWSGGNHNDGWCLGGVQANDGVYSGDWLLGDTFLRNVYVTHHAATSNQSPMIGLRGITDADSSLARFRFDRGDDSSPPAKVLSKAQGQGITSAGICGIAVAGGFVVGALAPLLACWILSRRGRRHSRY